MQSLPGDGKWSKTFKDIHTNTIANYSTTKYTIFPTLVMDSTTRAGDKDSKEADCLSIVSMP